MTADRKFYGNVTFFMRVVRTDGICDHTVTFGRLHDTKVRLNPKSSQPSGGVACVHTARINFTQHVSQWLALARIY